MITLISSGRGTGRAGANGASTLSEPSVTSRSWIVVAVHKLLLRTARTPVGWLWALVHRLIARAGAAYLLWGNKGGEAYTRGSLDSVDFLAGLSDIDLVVVLAPDRGGPGVAEARARARWERLRRAFPAVDLVLDHPRIYERPGLDQVAGSSSYTYGLEGPAGDRHDRSAYFAVGSSADTIRTLQRPGLYGTSAGWKLLRGRDRRPREGAADAQDLRVSAWLELQHWWRYAFPVCVDATGPRTASLCLKLVAEPARIWLLLAHGEQIQGREEVLRRALVRLPEEEGVLRWALDLHARLPDSPPPPVEQTVRTLLRFSERIAGVIGEQIAAAGATEVELAGVDPPELIVAHGSWRPIESLTGGDDPRQLPFCDWREITVPVRPDRTLAALPGDPGDPALLAAASLVPQPGPQPAFLAKDLLVLPSVRRFLSQLRCIQCAATDPVSFALLLGDGAARFPNVRGWSVQDTARRAVAEHRARLAADSRIPAGGSDDGETLTTLITTARAALLWETTAEGEPQLPVTVTETLRRLGDRSSAARTVAEDALEHYGAFVRQLTPPPAPTVAELDRVVRGLPAFGVSGVRSSLGARGL